MQKETVEIKTEFITIDKLLKFAGVADTGGQAFQYVLDRNIKINGNVIHEKRKKVFPGDIVNVDNQVELIVVRESDENI